MTKASPFQELCEQLIRLVERLEEITPNIAKTHVGDAKVSERLQASGALRHILQTHKIEVPPVSEAVKKRVGDCVSSTGSE